MPVNQLNEREIDPRVAGLAVALLMSQELLVGPKGVENVVRATGELETIMKRKGADKHDEEAMLGGYDAGVERNFGERSRIVH